MSPTSRSQVVQGHMIICMVIATNLNNRNNGLGDTQDCCHMDDENHDQEVGFEFNKIIRDE